ncbi:MAG: isoprenylcysteine carboxylmethyltransferase family protein [Oscillospiraceae bacterium]|nr:isoprenylcysteine carboxylmethyltransferase family protein [Oscillospiraceae bacterium]
MSLNAFFFPLSCSLLSFGALPLLALFYGAYLFQLFHMKKQGVAADLLGSGGKPHAAFEKALKIFTYAGAFVQLLNALFLFPGMVTSAVFVLNDPKMQRLWERASGVSAVCGLAAMALGAGIFIAAIAAMGMNWRAGCSEGQGTQLVTTGVYAHSRNPAFLGFDLLYIGCFFACPSVFGLLLAVAAPVMFHHQIRTEERFCAAAFGEEYQAYQAKVKRYF